MSGHNDIRFAVSNICTALDPETVGSKVDLIATFMRLLEDAVIHHEISKDRAPGQHYWRCNACDCSRACFFWS